MWSRKTRAPRWQIRGDGHCSTENEMPNLLWRFPRAPRWRSAQGCDGTNQNRPAALRHTWPQTHPRKYKHAVAKNPINIHAFKAPSRLFSDTVNWCIYVIRWDHFYIFFCTHLCGLPWLHWYKFKTSSFVSYVFTFHIPLVCVHKCVTCRKAWRARNLQRKHTSVIYFSFFFSS